MLKLPANYANYGHLKAVNKNRVDAKLLKQLLLGLYGNINSYRNFLRTKYSFISFPKCGRTWLTVMVSKALQCKFGLQDINTWRVLDYLAKNKITGQITV